MTRQLRLGLLRLVDSAPVVMAEAEGLFAAEGLDVALSVEPSWANVADKLSYGALDAAVILPPLAIAIAAGLRGVRRRLVLPMSLSAGGNALTVAPGLATRIGLEGSALERARRLKAALADIPPPRLGVVHGYSTHNLLLRYWLAAGGIDPDRDVEIITVPPEATARRPGGGRHGRLLRRRALGRGRAGERRRRAPAGHHRDLARASREGAGRRRRTGRGRSGDGPRPRSRPPAGGPAL